MAAEILISAPKKLMSKAEIVISALEIGVSVAEIIIPMTEISISESEMIAGVSSVIGFRDENECVCSGNDYGCRLNNYFAGGKGRVVDGLNRRWGADNCVGVINDR